MSAFIRPRTYTPRDATIYQQRPAALIDAVEEADAPIYPTVHVFHGHSAPLLIQAAGPAFLVTHQLTGATRYALCDRSWSTTATSVIDAAPADAQEASWEQWAEQAREAFVQPHRQWQVRHQRVDQLVREGVLHLVIDR